MVYERFVVSALFSIRFAAVTVSYLHMCLLLITYLLNYLLISVTLYLYKKSTQNKYLFFFIVLILFFFLLNIFILSLYIVEENTSGFIWQVMFTYKLQSA